MYRILLFHLMLLVSVLTGCAENGSNSIRTSSVPFAALDSAVPVVRVMVGGRQGLFILDTGAESTVVTPAFAQRMGLTLKKSDQQINDAHQATRRINGTTIIPSLMIGDSEFVNIPANCLPLSGIFYNNQPIDGLLSRAVFKQVLLTVDYPKKIVTVENGSLPEPDNDAIVEAPVSVDESIRVSVDLGDKKPRWFLIDTGFASPMSIANDVLRSVPATEILGASHQSQGVNSQMTMDVLKLKNPVKIGQLVWNDVPVLQFAGSRNMIGSGLLLSYRITFDQRNFRVRFER